jgi:hypothetical protein
VRAPATMSYRRAAWAVAVMSLVLAACGSGGPGSGRAAFRSAFAGQRASVNRIAAELRATLDQAGPDPDALLADSFSALGARAAQKAAVVEDLIHPPADNTRLRDLGSALLAVANGLGDLSTAATEHEPAATRAERRALRVDAADVSQTEAALAQAVGLPAG